MPGKRLKNLKDAAKNFAWPAWAIAGAYAMLTFAILAAVLVFHKTTFFTNLDNVDQFYSWYQKLATSVHHGNLPIWNSNVFAGQSFAGEIQPGVFYPLNLLFVWLFGSVQGISQAALDYLVAFHFLLAAFGAYMVLKQMRLKTLAAFCSGLVFAFSGVLVTRAISQTAIFFGLCLVPYPLLFLLKYYNSNKRKIWLIAGGIALGLIILSGHIQPFFHALLILAIFEAARFKRRPKSALFGLLRPAWDSLKRFIALLFVAFMVALPQIWLSYQYLPQTYRVQAEGFLGPGQTLDYGHFAKSFNIEPHEAANFIEPTKYPIRDGNNLFIGLLPLAIIILGFIFGKKQLKQSEVWREHSRFIIGLLLVSTLAMLGYWTWFAVFLYELPLVRQVRQLGRYAIVFQLGITMLLALYFETLTKLKLTSKQTLRLLAIAAFLAVNSLYILLLRRYIFDAHFAVQTFILAAGLAAIALPLKYHWRTSLLVGLLVATVAANGLWYLPRIKADTETPAVYHLKPALAELLQQTDGQYRVETEDNSLPLNIGNTYNFQITGGYSATIYAPYYEFSHKESLKSEVRKDLLGVAYVVKKQKPTPGQETIYQDETNKIYVIKRPSVLGKFFTTKQPGSVSRSDYDSLPSTTEAYKDHYQKYTVTAAKSGPVIISEIQYPGWKLKIDGKTAEWKAYDIEGTAIFRSFDLAAGKHTIEFEYRPFGF